MSEIHDAKLGSLTSGLSGLAIPLPKRDFPLEFQDKSRLTYYASVFNSIEINSSFYKLPQVSTIKKWAESVPDDFRFTFKLWKQITHNKGLVFNEEDIHRFIDVISNVGDKQGCLLVQFPPSIAIENIRQLEKLLVNVKYADPENRWNIAVEFRNRSWYEEEVYELLANYNSSMVLHDLPASAAPIMDNGDFIYVRFHGPNGGYRGSYPDDYLYEYAYYIQDWRKEGKLVYVYFNNTMGDAYKNLISLKAFAEQIG